MRPVTREVWMKATAISTGMKVPEVLIPTRTRRNTTISTPMGISSSPLNRACSSSGRLWMEKFIISDFSNFCARATFTGCSCSIIEKVTREL
ncbi:hypothetical protein D3C79_837870 [compost metagenome]